MWFILVNAKQNFQQFSVSQYPSEIILICWFDVQKKFLLALLKTVMLLKFKDSLMNRKQKTAFIFEIEILLTPNFRMLVCMCKQLNFWSIPYFGKYIKPLSNIH